MSINNNDATQQRYKVYIDAGVLYKIIKLLTGPSHHLREMQALSGSSINELTGFENPINQLVDEYNAEVKRVNQLVDSGCQTAQMQTPGDFVKVASYCGDEFTRYTIEWENGPLPIGTELFARISDIPTETQQPTEQSPPVLDMQTGEENTFVVREYIAFDHSQDIAAQSLHEFNLREITCAKINSDHSQYSTNGHFVQTPQLVAYHLSLANSMTGQTTELHLKLRNPASIKCNVPEPTELNITVFDNWYFTFEGAFCFDDLSGKLLVKYPVLTSDMPAWQQASKSTDPSGVSVKIKGFDIDYTYAAVKTSE